MCQKAADNHHQTLQPAATQPITVAYMSHSKSGKKAAKQKHQQ
jgi:hypothetical protein